MNPKVNPKILLSIFHEGPVHAVYAALPSHALHLRNNCQIFLLSFPESLHSMPFSLYREVCSGEQVQPFQSSLSSNLPSGAEFSHGRGCIAEVKEHPLPFELAIRHSIWPTFYQELSEPLMKYAIMIVICS